MLPYAYHAKCLLEDNHPYVYGQAYTKDWKPYPSEAVSTSTKEKEGTTAGIYGPKDSLLPRNRLNLFQRSAKELKPYSSEASSSSSTQDKEKTIAEIYGPKYYLIPKNKLDLFQKCYCKKCYWEKNAKQFAIELGLKRLKRLERETWKKQREMELQKELELQRASVLDLKKKYGVTSKFSFKTYMENKRKLMKKEMCETNVDTIVKIEKK